MESKDLYMGVEKELSYSSVQNQIKFLQGKVLTIVDASYSNDRQLQAVKDLVNRVFSEQLTWMAQICFPNLSMRTREQVKESGVDVDKIEADYKK